jgi:hypothetical protein
MNNMKLKTPTTAPVHPKRTPSEACIICNRTINDVGGYRIVGQKLRGVALSHKYMGGGNKDYPYQSVKLEDGSGLYVVVWGEQSKWTQPTVEKAWKEFLAGRRPWFCQVCGERTCSDCGSPINYPMGSDILHDKGCTSHAAIFPIDTGCMNAGCGNYREFEWRNDS